MSKLYGAILFAVIAAWTISTLADAMATPEEARALSEKAMAAVDEMGKDAAFVAFADPQGGFQEKDLYVFCMDMDGVMLTHAKKPELVGNNLHEFNKYGDYLFRDMIAVAKVEGSGWVDYRWPYPGTEEVREKTSYIIAHGDDFFCGVGAYK